MAENKKSSKQPCHPTAHLVSNGQRLSKAGVDHGDCIFDAETARYNELKNAKYAVAVRIGIGSAALALWLVLFSGGLLLETVEERAFLAPHAFPDHSKKNKELGMAVKSFDGKEVTAFVRAALWFTPTNLALLSLCAGLLGGCSSNIHFEGMSLEQFMKLHPDSRQYLAEAPWFAMIRSFIVYMCVLAGLYFALDDPFKDSTPSQYTRLAGTVSVLSFIVGYDPTRIRLWLRIVPTPETLKATRDTEIVTDGRTNVLTRHDTLSVVGVPEPSASPGDGQPKKPR